MTERVKFLLDIKKNIKLKIILKKKMLQIIKMKETN